MKRILNVLVLGWLVLTTMNMQAQDDKKDKLEIEGFVRNYTGLLFDSGDFSIVQNTLDLTLKQKKKNIGFTANAFAYHYPYQKNTFDIRELYVDLYSKKMDFRIGKQQIIWGQADGVFITDIVSPLNLTEFLLWDFNEIRMGVTSVKAKYFPHQDHDFELVWIPSFTPSILPASGSIWRPQQVFPAPVTFDFGHAIPSNNIENSEVFGRYSLSKSAIDLQLIGGYTWDDNPSMHVQRHIDSTMQLTGLTISPEHHRLTVVGANFSVPIKSFILRGEGAYYQGKHFQTHNPMDQDALVDKDYLNYVVGLDHTAGDWRLSTQFIQKRILDYEDPIAADEVDNLMTFMVNRTLMREQIRLELFSYIGFNNEDAFIRLRGYYFPSDGVGIELGTNVFVGDKGQFGQYSDNSMVYTRVKYSF